MTISYPPFLKTLDPHERNVARAVINELSSTGGAVCLLAGGSMTLPDWKKLFVDIDLWLITKRAEGIKAQVRLIAQQLPHLSFIYDGGYLPWLGEFLSLFFFEDLSFSVDVGISDESHMAELNLGPTPVVIWGDGNRVLSNLRRQRYLRSEHARLDDILVNLLKIRKNLVRGHIWNAIEYLSRARRELMAILAPDQDRKPIRYVRTDRDIEDLLSGENLTRLAETCPTYSIESVSENASRIATLCLHKIAQEGIVWPQGRYLTTLKDSLTGLIKQKQAGQEE